MALAPDVRAAVERAHEIAASIALWPGFHFADLPLLLHGRAEAVLIGHPAPPAGYQPAGEVAGRPVYTGPALPEMAANTATEVAGQLSALAMMPEGPLEEVDGYARLLLHEAFHVFQQTALPLDGRLDRVALQQMQRYPENDPVNNALAIVENQQLIAALQGEEGALGRFLSVRLHRHKRLGRTEFGEMAGYEQVAEYVEGTPTYVEVRAGRPLADLCAQLERCNVGGKWAAYRRFYWTGAAQALLLDQHLPGWQEWLASGNKSLQDLLLEAAGRLPAVGGVVKAVGFTAVLEREEQAALERRLQIEELLAQLDSGPGLRVEILLPPTVQGILWDPTNLLNLAPGTRLHTRFCGAMGPDGLRLEIERLCKEESGPDGRRFTFRLPAAPLVEPGERFRVSAEGLRLDAPAGQVEAGGPTLRITLFE